MLVSSILRSHLSYLILHIQSGVHYDTAEHVDFNSKNQLIGLHKVLMLFFMSLNILSCIEQKFTYAMQSLA